MSEGFVDAWIPGLTSDVSGSLKYSTGYMEAVLGTISTDITYTAYNPSMTMDASIPLFIISARAGVHDPRVDVHADIPRFAFESTIRNTPQSGDRFLEAELPSLSGEIYLGCSNVTMEGPSGVIEFSWSIRGVSNNTVSPWLDISMRAPTASILFGPRADILGSIPVWLIDSYIVAGGSATGAIPSWTLETEMTSFVLESGIPIFRPGISIGPGMYFYAEGGMPPFRFSGFEYLHEAETGPFISIAASVPSFTLDIFSAGSIEINIAGNLVLSGSTVEWHTFSMDAGIPKLFTGDQKRSAYE